jgi:hypothetical protein
MTKHWPVVSKVHSTVNKHVRIMHNLRPIWPMKFLKSTDPHFLDQVTEYAEGEEPDDAPDALAGAVEKMATGGIAMWDAGE